MALNLSSPKGKIYKAFRECREENESLRKHFDPLCAALDDAIGMMMACRHTEENEEGAIDSEIMSASLTLEAARIALEVQP